MSVVYVRLSFFGSNFWTKKRPRNVTKIWQLKKLRRISLQKYLYVSLYGIFDACLRRFLETWRFREVRRISLSFLVNLKFCFFSTHFSEFNKCSTHFFKNCVKDLKKLEKCVEWLKKLKKCVEQLKTLEKCVELIFYRKHRKILREMRRKSWLFVFEQKYQRNASKYTLISFFGNLIREMRRRAFCRIFWVPFRGVFFGQTWTFSAPKKSKTDIYRFAASRGFAAHGALRAHFWLEILLKIKTNEKYENLKFWLQTTTWNPLLLKPFLKNPYPHKEFKFLEGNPPTLPEY